MTDDCRTRGGSLTSVMGEYESDNDLEDALMLGVHYSRRPRGRLERSYSVSDTTTTGQHAPDLLHEKTPGRGEERGARGVRGVRPMSARRPRLTSSFDDGCSGRERVSTSHVIATHRHRTSSASCADTSSTTDQAQKPRPRSTTGASNSISKLRGQLRSSALKDELKGQKEQTNSSRSTAKYHNNNNNNNTASSSNANKTPTMSREKDMANCRRQQLPRPVVPIRRTSLDVKSQDGDGRQSTGQSQRPRHRDQRKCKDDVTLAPRLHRRDQVESSDNATSRFNQPFHLSIYNSSG